MDGRLAVQSPFNNQKEADVILRTSDGANFYVYKNIISLASSFFRDLFEITQPTDTTSSLPTVDLPETRFILDHLLRICYPVREPSFKSMPIQFVEDCLRAARKYEMDYCVGVIERDLSPPMVGPLEPLNSDWSQQELYSLACRFNLESLANAAGHVIHYATIAPTSNGESSEPGLYDFSHTVAGRVYDNCMGDIPAGSLRRLLRTQDASTFHSLKDVIFSRPPVPFQLVEQYAVIPFNSPEAFGPLDLVLQAMDGVRHLVNAKVVSDHSTLLKSGAEGTTSHEKATEQALPIVEVPLQSCILAPVLHLVYHGEGETIPMMGLRQAETVFLAAKEYLNVTVADSFMSRQLRNYVDGNPLRVYLLAARNGLEAVAEVAALVIARRDLSREYDLEMERTEARYYVPLLQFAHEYKAAFIGAISVTPAQKAKLWEYASDTWAKICEYLGRDDEEDYDGLATALQFVGKRFDPKALPVDSGASRRSSRRGAAKGAQEDMGKSRVSRALKSVKLELGPR
ncbi:hypothetical protein BXZ70DRAFT_1006604 [Cristinia sonorae]|uniref:BTB domain-containing protein n=1 Tax=Cristinia sonorae TaxID=1940300 RepID=A0A8K0UU79_9AGAR|nr:hypothetical protein BXZ70DRAFT_1006604 [Cristinia sonorae]